MYASHMSSPPMPARWSDPEPRPLNVEETRKLAIFREISQTLAEQPDLKTALKSVLQLLAARSPVDIAGGMVLVFSGRSHQVEMQVTDGFSAGRPRGNGAPASSSVTGQVVQSGRPVVVPHIPRAGLPASPTAKTAPLRELTQVAVPITLEGRVVGAISVDYFFDP